MIKQLKIKNFTVFDQLEMNLSPKINVIIGENGTGKTHLLKVAYGLSTNQQMGTSLKTIDDGVALTTKLVRLFLPLEDKLGKLYRQGGAESAQLTLIFEDDQQTSVTFSNNSRHVKVQSCAETLSPQEGAVFIPTKEVLSFMKGFNSLYDKYELSFDQTYKDICTLLDLPVVREESLPAKSLWAMQEIEKICGGRFIFYGGGKVTFQTNGTEHSANVIAEGFRKIGILSRLLETGAIRPGVGGTLFWDEPEANLNPKLMRLMVELLLELSRQGQQIVLATHDYVLLKWLDLLSNPKEGDHVRYHALRRESDGQIALQSVDQYTSLDSTAISSSFSDLYDEEIKRALGG